MKELIVLSQLQSAKRSRLALLISVVTAILVIAFIALIVPLSSCAASTTSTPIPRDALDVVSLKPCGKTRDEALTRGCQFDLMSFVWIMSFVWTPPACHDKELPDDFPSLRNWAWYHDIKATQVADEHPVHQGKFDHLYVTWEYHKMHCQYMWRKLHRAMMSVSRVDGYIGNSNHTRHCLGQLDQRGIDPQSVNTHIIQKFPVCGV